MPVFTAIWTQISIQSLQSMQPTLELFQSLDIMTAVLIAPLTVPERQGDPANSPLSGEHCTGFGKTQDDQTTHDRRGRSDFPTPFPVISHLIVTGIQPARLAHLETEP